MGANAATCRQVADRLQTPYGSVIDRQKTVAASAARKGSGSGSALGARSARKISQLWMVIHTENKVSGDQNTSTRSRQMGRYAV